MTSSLSIQTPIEPPSKPVRKPSISFCGVDVFVDRKGDQVTGRVVFPHPVGGDLAEAEKAYREGTRVTGRTECPIRYRSKRPTESAIRNPQSEIAPRARQKLRVVMIYQEMCKALPNTSRRRLAERVVAEARADGVTRISVRTLQVWAQRYELEGLSGLMDRYVKPIPKSPVFDVEDARQALMVCAWWSFRIGNVKTIDTRMMAAVVKALVAGYSAADLLVVIDGYYAYHCDRERYPFKPFQKWIKYDLTLWVCRAADAADYRAIAAQGREGRTEGTPLLPPVRQHPPSVTDTCTRKREAACRRTQTEIAAMADEVAPDQATPDPAASETIAERLLVLPEKWRFMLLRACGPNADRTAQAAREEAIATLPLWWEVMPESATRVIDAKVDQWKSEHPQATDLACHARRFRMFLPRLRDRSTVADLAPARRFAL